MQRLERHRLAVGEPQPPDKDDPCVGGDVERAPDRGAGVHPAQLDRAAAGDHPAAAHVLANEVRVSCCAIFGSLTKVPAPWRRSR